MRKLAIASIGFSAAVYCAVYSVLPVHIGVFACFLFGLLFFAGGRRRWAIVLRTGAFGAAFGFLWVLLQEAVLPYFPALSFDLPGKAKEAVLQQIDAVFSAADRPFFKSLLLGDKKEFYQDPALVAAMSRSGIMHVVAVSGMHLSFLVGAIRLFLGNSRKSALLCLLPVWFFVAVTGFTPSAVRAGFMQTMALAACLFNRENDALTTLSFALAVLLFADPETGKNAGTQLSFASVAGLMLFSERINEAILSAVGRIAERRIVQAVVSILASSVSVMILTVPLTALQFSSIQILSPLTNVLVMWAVSLCFCGGYLACGASFVSLSLGRLIAIPVSLLGRWILFAAKAVSSIPFAALYTCSDFAVYWVAGVYAVFLLFALLPLSRRISVFCPLALSVASLAVLLMGTHRYYADAAAVFSAINVGQGQSVAVFSGEETLVVDCGSIFTLDNAGEAAGQYLLSCGRQRVDLLLLTHLHKDHVNGIPMLMEYLPVEEIVYYEDAEDEDNCLEQILTAADRHGTLVTVIGPEAEAQIGNISVSMQVPCLTGDANDRCVFALVSVEEFDLLVTGDAPKAAEQTYLRQKDLPPVELLIAGHHGSKYSTSQELIRACRGADAVISSGYNTFGHPSEEALRALSALHSVHRTDQEGTVQFFYRKE
ncbi:MAG: ComEC/Rec2 family competence protein [Oscillospiraceae bacterium]|nr:ComEC/Rec2 family competence protein [Oscillospiraceae bacterium]